MSENRLTHVAGCGCRMCRQIEEYRKGHADWEHRDGCGCAKCNLVESLAAVREAEKAARAAQAAAGAACACGGACCSKKPAVTGADVGGALGEAVCGPVCGLAGRVIGSFFD